MNLEARSGQLFPHFLHFLCQLSFLLLLSLSSPPPRFSSPLLQSTVLEPNMWSKLSLKSQRSFHPGRN